MQYQCSALPAELSYHLFTCKHQLYNYRTIVCSLELMMNILQELTSAQAVSQEITNEKKKKEKPVAMSLSEFRQTGITEGTQCAPKSENLHSMTGLDSFLEWPDDSTSAVTQNHERSNMQGWITTSCFSVLVAQSSLVCICW